MKLSNWIASAIASTFVLAAPAQAATLKLATIAPPGSVWDNHVTEFVNAVQAADIGVEIEVFNGGQLGNMIDTFKNTLSGRVDIWVGASPVMAAITPEMGLFSLPYLFDSTDEMACAVPKVLDDARALTGGKYQLLQLVSVDSQAVSGVDPVRVPADMQGMKIRSAPIPASMAFFNSMGATPQPLPATETPSALGTGLVTGTDFGGVYYTLTGAHKTATNYTATNHNIVLGGYLMSAKAWGGLSAEQQTAIVAAAEALDVGRTWDDVAAFEAALLQKALAEGATVVELTDEERALWVEAGRAVWDEVIGGMNGDPRAFLEKINAARASCN